MERWAGTESCLQRRQAGRQTWKLAVFGRSCGLYTARGARIEP
jgi:hypothetical protein